MHTTGICETILHDIKSMYLCKRNTYRLRKTYIFVFINIRPPSSERNYNNNAPHQVSPYNSHHHCSGNKQQQHRGYAQSSRLTILINRGKQQPASPV